MHCREEVFGPVLAVVKYHTDAEAIALANDSPFGLGSTVFSSSKSRANAIAHQLQVHVLADLLMQSASAAIFCAFVHIKGATGTIGGPWGHMGTGDLNAIHESCDSAHVHVDPMLDAGCCYLSR